MEMAQGLRGIVKIQELHSQKHRDILTNLTIKRIISININTRSVAIQEIQEYFQGTTVGNSTVGSVEQSFLSEEEHWLDIWAPMYVEDVVSSYQAQEGLRTGSREVDGRLSWQDNVEGFSQFHNEWIRTVQFLNYTHEVSRVLDAEKLQEENVLASGKGINGQK